MDQDRLIEMADAIFSAGPPLDRDQIIAALNAYWTGRMAIVWDRSDLFGQAWARGKLLTNEQADDLLDDLRRHHDPELGVTWTSIECALDEIEPLDIEKLDLTTTLMAYPGNFQVWWDGTQTGQIFDTDDDRNLFHALSFAARKAEQVKGAVQVCIVDAADNEYPLVYYEILDGKLLIKPASNKIQ